MPLVDACVTEWRLTAASSGTVHSGWCHSLMPVLLNGGPSAPYTYRTTNLVPLVDACVTEWRQLALETLKPVYRGATR